MRKNGHKKPLDCAAEIALDRNAQAVTPAARPGVLSWMRRARRRALGRHGTGRPPRTFWMLDPVTGEWRLL